MVGRFIFALLGLLGAPIAQAQDEPGAALLAAIAARDPAAVNAAFAAGARPDRPSERPPAFVLLEALAATPDQATRATFLAFAESAQAAGFGPDVQIVAPMGNAGGSLAARLATVPGEEALFLRVAELTDPARRCNLLGQLIFGRDGANFAAAAAILPLIPPERAAEPACSLPFTMLANPSRRPPPSLVEAMLAAGLRPYPDALPALIRQLPAGEEGDGAFRRLAALDLGALATVAGNGARRRIPVLVQLGEDVLVDRAARAEPLLGRWNALLDAAPDEVACAALPGLVVRGWLSDGEGAAWTEALRRSTRSLLLRCPGEAFSEALAETEGDRLWDGLVRRGERSTFRLMLAAGLRPADPPRLGAALACAADARLLGTLMEAGVPLGSGLLPRFMACLGGLEASREGDIDTLGLILARASPDAPVAGDAPIAIAVGIDRPDLAGALGDHGAAPARLSPERQAFWRHRRLAALAGVQGPVLPWEANPDRVPAAPELMRLASGLGAWLIHGDCGDANCGYSIAVRDGRGYRLVLEDAGHGFQLERQIGRRARDATIQARSSASTQLVTTWRYDGRVYRRFRCREIVEEEGEGGTRQRVSDRRCGD